MRLYPSQSSVNVMFERFSPFILLFFFLSFFSSFFLFFFLSFSSLFPSFPACFLVSFSSSSSPLSSSDQNKTNDKVGRINSHHPDFFSVCLSLCVISPSSSCSLPFPSKIPFYPWPCMSSILSSYHQGWHMRKKCFLKELWPTMSCLMIAFGRWIPKQISSLLR